MGKVAVKLDDGRLEPGPRLGLDGLGQLLLGLDLRKVRCELVERHVLDGEVRLVCPDEREDVRVVDVEDPVGVRLFRDEQDVEEPLVGRQLLFLGGGDVLIALDDEERAARHRVERLDPALRQDGQTAEGLNGVRLTATTKNGILCLMRASSRGQTRQGVSGTG